ncbi:TIGR01244 family protein [Cognatiyoonia sediminum]|uniref:TIGR01244 family protein n=1 Tax=Cognatiyoonia sediminum TaxID=1508389 RepID=A0A1M5LDC9_9RHOB|nr:TIGR01244 family sulfur transferase [Cognatiyoonia sediminum]SHG63027.1 TIGR01244 family protein [Cognatiyoonia sediminum]
MDIRRLCDSYAVSPQINPEDVTAIKEAGFGTIICNRPDMEIPPSHHAEVVKAAAENVGLNFVKIPLTHQTMSVELAKEQRAIIDASDEPVFAYCASGTRCSIVWALGQAEDTSADDILNATSAAGYDLGGMRPTLDSLKKS